MPRHVGLTGYPIYIYIYIYSIYIYLITYTSTWVINDDAVWNADNAGPHCLLLESIQDPNTSDVSRNSLQLFESDPYGCHSQADPDRGDRGDRGWGDPQHVPNSHWFWLMNRGVSSGLALER